MRRPPSLPRSGWKNPRMSDQEAGCLSAQLEAGVFACAIQRSSAVGYEVRGRVVVCADAFR
jgi:hypothetical protein